MRSYCSGTPPSHWGSPTPYYCRPRKQAGTEKERLVRFLTNLTGPANNLAKNEPRKGIYCRHEVYQTLVIVLVFYGICAWTGVERLLVHLRMYHIPVHTHTSVISGSVTAHFSSQGVYIYSTEYQVPQIGDIGFSLCTSALLNCCIQGRKERAGVNV